MLATILSTHVYKKEHLGKVCAIFIKIYPNVPLSETMRNANDPTT